MGDRVLVKVDVSEEKSLGGILLPSSAQKKPTQGHVEKAGTAKAVRVSLCTFCILLYLQCSKKGWLYAHAAWRAQTGAVALTCWQCGHRDALAIQCGTLSRFPWHIPLEVALAAGNGANIR